MNERQEAEQALSRAARQVERVLAEHFYDAPTTVADAPPACPVSETPDRGANATTIKRAAVRLGADLVGICRMEERWLLGAIRQAQPAGVPGDLQNVVVMAVAMDAADISRSPGPAASAATMIGYMRMALCASALAAFVRQLGYRAVPSGNGLAMSIPLAVAAGLGEFGRNNSLITPQFGPCVRLCKVFTDMPLAADDPVTFGVADFCAACGKCVKACPAGAIDSHWPAARPADPNAPAHSDGVACRDFWRRNGTNCSTCIAVCPYTHAKGRPPAA